MSRNFGVECEYNNDNVPALSMVQAAALLTTAGIVCRAEGYDYNHNVSEIWKIVPDCTVSGGEAVSPILSGDAGISEARKVVSTLAKAGASVDGRTGLHVHVDTDGLTVQDIRNVLTRYSAFEQAIDAFMPRSRRDNNNDMCQSFSEYLTMAGFGNALSIRDLAMLIENRQVKVNIRAYLRHKTIEFRHHSGTLSPEKLENWVHFCLNFVEASRESNMGTPAPERVIRRRTTGTRRRRVSWQLIMLAEKLAELGTGSGFTVEELRSHCGYTSFVSVTQGLIRLSQDFDWAFYGASVSTVGRIPAMRQVSVAGTTRQASDRILRLARWFAANPGTIGTHDTLVDYSGFSEASLAPMVTRLRRDYGFCITRVRNLGFRCDTIGNSLPNGITRVTDTELTENSRTFRLQDDTCYRGLDPEIEAYYRERTSDFAQNES